MLINLSNHRSEKWSKEQLYLAIGMYNRVLDLTFPAIDPQAQLIDLEPLAKRYFDQCQQLVANDESHHEIHAVHIMGEMTFTYLVVNLLREAGIQAVASTTERHVTTDHEGNKVSVFRFVQFRPYYPAPAFNRKP